MGNPGSSIAEAYRNVRSAIRAAGVERKVGEITDVVPDAGKSAFTANLAVVVVQSGKYSTDGMRFRESSTAYALSARKSRPFQTRTLDSNKLVSVIIPVFDVYPYLVEALDSVLRQTYTKLEIIIIDDGSTDGSGKICDEYAEKDTRVLVIHQENKGLSTARNVGLDRMSGEVVVFLDADDAYHPDFVKGMLDAMAREKADQVICRYTNHCTTGKMGYKGKEKLEPPVESGMYDSVASLQALVDQEFGVEVWNRLYAKELWDNIRFPDGHVYESEEVTFRLHIRSKRIYVLDAPLYLHRIRHGSITTTLSWKNITDSLLSCSNTYAFIMTHTPEVFTWEQLKKRRQLLFHAMLACYTQLSCMKENGKNSFLKELIIDIVELRNEIDIEKCWLRTKIAFWMLLHCPWLLKFVYPVYCPVRQFLRRDAER